MYHIRLVDYNTERKEQTVLCGEPLSDKYEYCTIGFNQESEPLMESRRSLFKEVTCPQCIFMYKLVGRLS